MEKTQHNNNLKGLRHQKEKSSGNSSTSRVSVHLDTPELGRKKSEECRSSSDAGRLLSVKIPRGMMESKVDIDMSEDMMEDSRISRRERANSLQNERSKIMGTIAKEVILIEEESEQGSMKTTQNNDRS